MSEKKQNEQHVVTSEIFKKKGNRWFTKNSSKRRVVMLKVRKSDSKTHRTKP